jgi:DNA end-binding protein Ku
MATIAKMTIAFGLVTIPIKISAAARGLSVSFNLLHAECNHRINQKTVCAHCDKEITRAETVKGYEVEKDTFVVITPADLEELAPESSKVMEITAAVSASEIDPILFDASYYLEPEPAGKRGYKLLLSALVKENKAAVAKVTMHGHEQIVVIRPYRGTLMFHTMFYQDEVRSVPACGLENVEVKPAELKLACQLLDVHAATFDHAAYKDEYRAAVEVMLEAKAAKKPVPISKGTPKKAAPQGDIMAVLAASIKTKSKKGKVA